MDDHSARAESTLIAETKRLVLRYVSEIVLPLKLCPWAAPALAQGQVDIRVLTQPWHESTDLEHVARAVRDCLATTPSHIDLVLIAFPRFSTTRLGMDELLREFRKTDDRSFALAAFHPDAPADTQTAQRFIPYLRRSPDPLLQAVRQCRLDTINAEEHTGTRFVDPEALLGHLLKEPQKTSLRERLAKENLERAEEWGLEKLEARIDAILTDHRQSRVHYETMFSKGDAPDGAGTTQC